MTLRLSLPSFGTTLKSQPHHDPWPPTYRLPSGALQIEATYKEPARQKLVDKSARAVAFLALMVVVVGNAQWPFLKLTTVVLDMIGQGASATLPELIAARLMVGVIAIVAIVLTFRLSLAALGLDRGTMRVTFDPDRIVIDGQSFDRRVTHGFELEPHHRAKREDHRDRQQQIASPLYFRDSHIVMFQYGERRIEIAEILGKQHATKLVARLQTVQKTPTPILEVQCRSLQQKRA